MGFKLGFESILATTGKNDEKGCSRALLAIVNMTNAQYAVNIASKRVVAVICRDEKVREAVATITAAKHTIKAFGATESIMSVFNANNQLGNALSIQIPEINSVNCSSVGIACCEAIDAKVLEAHELVKKFFEELVANVANFFEKLEEVTACQKETLSNLASDLLADIEAIDAEAFAKEEVFGYAQAVFMDRLNALKTLVAKLGTCEANEEAIAEFSGVLETLGYKIREENKIEEETPAEAEATAPAEEEVMHEDPTEPETAPETEQPAVTPEEGEPAQEELDVPADAAQEQNMAVFGWNPGTIRDAINEVLALLGTVGELRPVEAKITELRTKALAAIETAEKAAAGEVVAPEGEQEPIPTPEGETTPETTPEAATEALEGAIDEVESCRVFAGFFGNAITLFQQNVNELVDQCVALCGKLKKAEVAPSDPDAVPVEEVTTEQPLGPEETPATNEGGEVVEPENVPEADPVDTPEVDPESKPQPVGGAEHTEEVETPEEKQSKTDLPGEQTESANDRFWHFQRG